MERSLSKKSRVLAEYVRKKSSLPTSYFGPDNNTLSSLPDYGVSNAALPRGEDPSVHPYKEIQAKETIMSTKQEIAKIAEELRTVKAELQKTAELSRIEEIALDALEKECKFALRNIEKIRSGKIEQGVEDLVWGVTNGGLKNKLDVFFKVFGRYWSL